MSSIRVRVADLAARFEGYMNNESIEETIFKAFVPTNNTRLVLEEFLEVLESSGIRKNDPRLKEFYDVLTEITEEKITFQTFKRLVSPNISLLSKALRRHLVIPDFKKFSEDIENIFESCVENNEGSVATKIPELARVNPKQWAVSICTVDGQRCSFGDFLVPFTLHTCSSPLVYAFVHEKLHEAVVHTYVDNEPTARLVHTLALNERHRPHNPLISTGVIVVCSLIHALIFPAESEMRCFERLLDFIKRLAGNEFVGFNNTIYTSEKEHGDKSRALAFFMKEHNCFPETANIDDSLSMYFRALSVEAHCESLSVIAATFANGGICPLTEEKMLSSNTVKNTLTLMLTCGMFDHSGRFAFKVGLPSKAGFSGCQMVVIPNILGMALWCPLVDKLGVTLKGLQFCEELLKVFKFHPFEAHALSCEKKSPVLVSKKVIEFNILNVLFFASKGDLRGLRRHYLRGFDMNVHDYDKRTALHVAASEGHLHCVRFLVENCAVKTDVSDRWGNTPIDNARTFGKEEIVEYLTTGNVVLRKEPEEGDSKTLCRSASDSAQSVQKAQVTSSQLITELLLMNEEEGSSPDVKRNESGSSKN